MDFKEFLSGLGLDEEVITKAETSLNEQGFKVMFDNAKDSGYIPKGRFDEVNTQKNAYKTQADELNTKLTEMQKQFKGNDEVQAQIQELQDKLANAEAQNKEISINSAIKEAALTAKAKNAEDVLHFVNKNDVKINPDGSIMGLDEQFKELVKNKPYLFNEDVPAPLAGRQPHAPTSPTGVQQQTFTIEQLKKMSPQEIAANMDAIDKALSGQQ